MRSGFTLASLGLVASLSLLGACAESGGAGGKCTGSKCVDLGIGGNDASVLDLRPVQDLTDPNAGHDFSEPSDMTRLFVFGEPCSDPLQCADSICVLSGVSGFCSKQCGSKSDCPGGFDCYGVLGGGIDPGLVVNICVPESNLLCTQCADSTECSATGRDLCLTSITGAKFCARDCSTVSCPANYECKTVTSGNKDYKQCLPTSGACDCNDDLKDTTSACTIMTPLNTSCAGAYTCQGTASGWSACQPPSMADTLDDYKDNNCDGVDGILTDAVFVATGGTDQDLCGLTFDMPCKTITYGIQIADTYNRPNVYVQAGYYDETVIMMNGINVIGGFDDTWQRAARTTSGHDVHIRGSSYYDSIENTSENISVWAHGLAVETTLQEVVVEGLTANVPGKSSYAIHVKGSKLTLKNVTVIGGNGKAGTNGTPGTDASSTYTYAMQGKDGANGREEPGCNTDRQSGGAAGTRTCANGDGSYFDASGGAGGQSGTVDTDCSCGTFDQWNCDYCSRGGIRGDAAPYNGGSCGTGSASFGCYGAASGSSCYDSGTPTPSGGGGKNGTTTNGGGGGGGNLGRISGSYWRPNDGADGKIGSHGSGGGGGGGSGGNDSGSPDDQGASGGGGGAGGCRAPSAGTAGTGGGGSFGVFALSSTLTLSGCTIQRGIGGAGGTGGDGGTGQPGAPGGPGGIAFSGVGKGGDGGDGAHGGHSGGGGGGAGGHSIGIFYYGTTLTGTCTATGGAVGAKGGAGLKAGDGNPGIAGSAGLSDTDDGDGKNFAYQCNNANGC